MMQQEEINEVAIVVDNKSSSNQAASKGMLLEETKEVPEAKPAKEEVK